MSQYSDLTRNLADTLTQALERVGGAQAEAIQRTRERLGRFTPQVPEPVSRRLPSAREITRANFALAQRLLDAQKAYTFGLLDALEPARPAGRKPAAGRKRSAAPAG